jgi:hypothetical protein
VGYINKRELRVGVVASLIGEGVFKKESNNTTAKQWYWYTVDLFYVTFIIVTHNLLSSNLYRFVNKKRYYKIKKQFSFSRASSVVIGSVQNLLLLHSATLSLSFSLSLSKHSAQ